jgi:PAS domain S-box-containing protein
MYPDAASAQPVTRQDDPLLRSIFSQTAIPIAQAGLDGQWLRVNDRFCEMLGYTQAELRTKTWTEIKHPDDVMAAQAGSHLLLSGQLSAQITEKRYIRKDGSILWARINRFLVRDECSRPHSFVSIIEQISDRKQTEFALKETEQRLRLAQSATGIVLWELDLCTQQIKHSEDFNALYGLDPKRGALSPADLVACIHPEDRRDIRNLLKRASRSTRGWEVEYRVVWPDTTVHWLYSKTSPWLDDTGRPVRISGITFDITERKQAEIALRETELRYKELFENTSDCIFLIDVTPDHRFKIAGFNPAEEKATGISSVDAAGKFVEDLFSFEITQAVTSNYRRCLEANDTISYEEAIDLSSGRHYFHTILIPVRNRARQIHRLVGVARDITALKEAEAAVRESEARFRDLANSACVMICASGPDKLATFFNKTWLEFRGRSSEEELGFGWLDGVHPEDKDICLEKYSKCFDARRKCHLEYRLRRADGEYRWVVCDGVPHFDSYSRFKGYIASCIDITELRHAQENALAAQKLESIGVLATGIAHDFNNLLGGILACSELALGEPSNPNEYLNLIRNSAMRGAEVVQQLIIYGGGENPSREAVDLSRAIEDALERLKDSMGQQTRLMVDLDRAIPEILANPGQIRQAILNVLSNAAESIGDKEGVIKITTKCKPANRAEAGLPEREYIFMTVTDTGGGMTPEVKARVFDPFFTTKQVGRGLGMAVVQGIVRAHAGMVTLNSAPGMGTQVQIAFPRSENIRKKSEPNDKLAQQSKSLSQAPHTILIVEDEENLAIAISKALGKKGFQVLHAANGSSAIKLIRAHPQEIGVVLLDLTLPGTSSFEVFQEARRSRAEMKVIVTTAFPKDKAVAAFPGLRIDYFIQKPFRLADLLELLQA